jgi:hypothetical protein
LNEWGRRIFGIVQVKHLEQGRLNLITDIICPSDSQQVNFNLGMFRAPDPDRYRIEPPRSFRVSSIPGTPECDLLNAGFTKRLEEHRMAPAPAEVIGGRDFQSPFEFRHQHSFNKIAIDLLEVHCLMDVPNDPTPLNARRADVMEHLFPAVFCRECFPID